MQYIPKKNRIPNTLPLLPLLPLLPPLLLLLLLELLLLPFVLPFLLPLLLLLLFFLLLFLILLILLASGGFEPIRGGAKGIRQCLRCMMQRVVLLLGGRRRV